MDTKVKLLCDMVFRGTSYPKGAVILMPPGVAGRSLVAGVAERCSQDEELYVPQKPKTRKRTKKA